MRKLVFGATVAVAASQAGCFISGGDEVEFGLITANWSFNTVDGGVVAGCPVGFDTAAVTATPIDDAGREIGKADVALFDCAAGTGTADFEIGVYRVFVDITNGNGTASYGKTLPAILDIIDLDQTYTAQLLEDGGYFGFGWELIGGNSNRLIECEDVIGGVDGVEVVATLSTGGEATADKFNCRDHGAFTPGLIAGDYEISIDAFRDGADGGALGPPVEFAAKRILPQNEVTDLGTLMLPITGQ